ALADTVADTPEESQEAVFGTGFKGITDIKVGPDGNLYVLSFKEGAIYKLSSSRAQEDDDNDAKTAKLTVRSEDLSGNTISGMYTVIEDDDGNVLAEGYTPLTFEGEVGSTYTVIVSDFRDREFEQWDDDPDDRNRTVTLEEDDTTITAHYEIESSDVDSNNRNSNTPIFDRLTKVLRIDDCFDEQGRHRLYSAISNMVAKRGSGEERNTDRLQRLIEQVAADGVDNDGDDDNRRQHGNSKR